LAREIQEGVMMRRRLDLAKLLAFGMALAFLAALLPLAALAVEEENGSPGGAYEDGTGAGNSGEELEPGTPAEPAPEPEPPEHGGESGTPAEPAPDPEPPEHGGESGTPAEPAPEPEPPEHGGESGTPAEPVPEPEPPEHGGESGTPAEPPEGAGDGDAPLEELPEEGDIPPAGLETPAVPEAPEVLAASLSADTRGRITLDGSLADWAEVPEMTHGDPAIDGWKAALDLEGNLYLCFTGMASTSYDESYFYKSVIIHQGGNLQQSTLRDLPQTFDGGEVVVESGANVQSAAPYYLEAMIPAAYVSGGEGTLALGWDGPPVPLSQLPVLDGVDLPKVEPVYDGISIDGSFSDWDAVPKYPFQDTNPGWNNLDSAAFLFDGDLYVYIKEVPGGDAATAGSLSTGNYVITTDLGRVLKFQLKKENGGSVYGVAGAEARHVGMQWEIRIPASELPYYRETLSFGLYLEEAAITGVSNLQGGGGNVGGFSGIVIDGAYDDWVSYPHSIIEYATPGSQAPQTDSQGALYFEEGKLYGHVMTTMPEHLASQGGDFLAAIDIAFNGDREQKGFFEEGNFYPCMFTEDGQMVNEYTRLEPGVHTFRICDIRTLGDPERQVFGTMKVTVDENRLCDEMEFDLDLEAVAERQGCTVNDLRTIEARFGRFGSWITISGASSGALLGVTLCCGVTAGTLFRRRKRGGAL
jgi:hypothetical protein